jgi:hypothetical protein
MSEPYVGPEAGALDLIAGLLAGTTTWQTLTGTASPTLARATIVEGIDAAVVTTTAHALVSVDDPEFTGDDASGDWTATVEATLDMFWPNYVTIPATTDHDALIRAYGHFAAIRSAILAAAPGNVLTCSGAAPMRCDLSEQMPDWWVSSLTLSIRCRP